MKDKAEKSTESEEESQLNHGSLRERLARVKKTRWIRFTVVAVIFVAWVAWLGSWWVLIFLPLLADIYLTQFIPWNWWKFTKNKAVRTVMSWVDAIVYALILVYFLFLYFGQNYQIPSSSLEKTLLTGDFLWVNKIVYGPRVPETPIHFPLAQNTLPILNCKSYIEHPQWDYHRLKGLRDVARFDIVVFNFPAGDTVALKCPNPDYYTLVKQFGHDAVWNDKEKYGDIVYRPVDRRDNYVKRAIGLPGEWLHIINGTIYINGKKLPEPKNVQYFYFVHTNGAFIDDQLFDELGINMEDRHGNAPDYILPLTAQMKKTLESYSWVLSINKMPADPSEIGFTFPMTANYGWTHNDFGPLWIPKKGATVKLTLRDLPEYERCITNYEGNKLEVKGDKIYINGRQTEYYTFKMNYYWMMGDNRDNSLDSRFWGFVPEDHVVGTPMFVIISFNKDKPLFKGGIRWNRLFKDANPDK
jgi:signal peptidase I